VYNKAKRLPAASQIKIFYFLRIQIAIFSLIFNFQNLPNGPFTDPGQGTIERTGTLLQALCAAHAAGERSKRFTTF
jgi:hypothetical protein